MIAITEVVWRKINDAVSKPTAFKKRRERKTLLAAVDSAVEQITNDLLGPGARSREQMIRGLNQFIARNRGDDLARAVLAVLNDFKKVDALSYDEDDDPFAAFVEERLKPIISLTKYA